MSPGPGLSGRRPYTGRRRMQYAIVVLLLGDPRTWVAGWVGFVPDAQDGWTPFVGVMLIKDAGVAFEVGPITHVAVDGPSGRQGAHLERTLL